MVTTVKYSESRNPMLRRAEKQPAPNPTQANNRMITITRERCFRVRPEPEVAKFLVVMKSMSNVTFVVVLTMVEATVNQ
jgi:hypothetical protein